MPKVEVLLSDGRRVRVDADCGHAVGEYLFEYASPDENGEPTVIPIHAVGDEREKRLYRFELTNDGGETTQRVTEGHEGFCAIWQALDEVSAMDGDESWTVTHMEEVKESVEEEDESSLIGREGA